MRSARAAGAARRIGCCIALLALCCASWGVLSRAAGPPSFDGAMNLRVAASVAAGRGYGFRYGVFFPFPAQTDGPLVLPAAAVFRVFGIGLASAQAVPVAYAVGFAVALATLLRLGGCGWGIALGGLAAVLALPGMRDYGTGGYGEVPSLCWLLVGLCCGMRGSRREAADGGWWLAGAGLASGIAAITKVSAVMAVVPVLAVMVTTALVGRRWADAGMLAGGAVLPPLDWELFRCRALGGIEPWRHWWRLQLEQVGKQSGSAGTGWEPAAVAARVVAHAGVLEHAAGVGAVLLAALLLLPWLGAARVAAAQNVAPERRMAVAASALASAVLFAWWLAVAPDDMTWLRRILPGLVLQVMLVALLLPALGEWRWRVAAAGMPAVAVLLMAGHGAKGPGLGETLRRRAEVARVASAIRALPADAVLFGAGWWQAPVLTLLSGRTAENFERWVPTAVAALPNAFFLSDRDGNEIAGPPERLLDDVVALRAVVQTPSGALWRMVAVDAAMPMRDGARGDAFDAARDEQAPGEGWYPSAGGWAWVRPNSVLLLERTSQRALVLDAAFWNEMFPGGRALTLRVRAAGCLDRTVSVPGAGLRRLVLRLDCAPAAAGVPFAVRIDTDRSMPVPRQLDADTRERSFEIRRAALAAAG